MSRLSGPGTERGPTVLRAAGPRSPLDASTWSMGSPVGVFGTTKEDTLRNRLGLGLLTLMAFLLSASPAQAQPLVAFSCSSVTVDFRTSIQPDSATVEITSNAGTESHSVTLAAGGTEPVTFPLDGQNGETVTVTVTLVYRG